MSRWCTSIKGSHAGIFGKPGRHVRFIVKHGSWLVATYLKALSQTDTFSTTLQITPFISGWESKTVFKRMPSSWRLMRRLPSLAVYWRAVDLMDKSSESLQLMALNGVWDLSRLVMKVPLQGLRTLERRLRAISPWNEKLEVSFMAFYQQRVTHIVQRQLFGVLHSI